MCYNTSINKTTTIRENDMITKFKYSNGTLIQVPVQIGDDIYSIINDEYNDYEIVSFNEALNTLTIKNLHVNNEVLVIDADDRRYKKI